MKSFIESRYGHKESVSGVILVEKPMQFSALIGGFDVLVLVVAESKDDISRTLHYSKDNLYIQERWYDCNGLERILSHEETSDVQQWVIAGDIVVDRDGYLAAKKNVLLQMSQERKEQRLFSEFGLFLRHFLLSKNYLEEGDVLDAHSHILTAIHHWARIAAIEQGQLPELTVWKQVRKINPGIFKLYEELTMTTETLEQRIQLAHLACDFSVMSKLKECCGPLLRVLSSRNEPWSAGELEEHPELKAVQTELQLMLKKLVSKSLIEQVFITSDAQLDVLEMRYTS